MIFRPRPTGDGAHDLLAPALLTSRQVRVEALTKALSLTSYEVSGGTLQGTLLALVHAFVGHCEEFGLDPEDAMLRVTAHHKRHGLRVAREDMPPDLRRLVAAINRTRKD